MSALNSAPADPSNNHSGGAVSRFFRALSQRLMVVAIPVAMMWIIHLLNFLPAVNLLNFGLRPRDLDGLIGVIAMPLLHVDWTHLIGNSLAWLVLGSTLALLTGKFLWLTVHLWWLSGVLTWLVGRSDTLHVGASGVVYGFAAFVMLYGFLTRRFVPLTVSVIVIVNYAYFVHGLFPQSDISWEGHLCGALAGVVVAWFATAGPRRERQRRRQRHLETDSSLAVEASDRNGRL